MQSVRVGRQLEREGGGVRVCQRVAFLFLFYGSNLSRVVLFRAVYWEKATKRFGAPRHRKKAVLCVMSFVVSFFLVLERTPGCLLAPARRQSQPIFLSGFSVEMAEKTRGILIGSERKEVARLLQWLPTSSQCVCRAF